MPAPLFGHHLNAALYGDPVYIGTIVATAAPADNANTSSPFCDSGERLRGKMLLLQPDVACYVRQNAVVNGGVTSTNGVKLAADQLFLTNMRGSKGYLAAVAVSGTVNLRVFEMNG